MHFVRREFLRLAAAAAILNAFSRPARATDYPSRRVRVIVGLPAGLAPDVAARLVAPPLSERLGQVVVVENRPGAAGNIGAEYVVRAAPDGYTLLAAISGNAINASLYSNLPFNFVRDLAPVALYGFTPYVMVISASVPVKTLPEFIAYAKANPGKVNMASPGIGTAPHLAGELFKMMTGVDMVHVPYKANYLPDLIGGQVQVAFIALGPVRGYIQGGQLRALGVTSTQRLEVLPEVPAIAEAVPGYEGSGWLGVCAPKDTPAEIVSRLNREINAVTSQPEAKKQLLDLGIEPAPLSPQQFAELIAGATAKWAEVVKFADIKVE